MFRQHDETDDLDASLLLLPIMDFLPPMTSGSSTVLAIADELTQDGLVLRYKAEEPTPGFPGEEGLNICSFWLVSALAMIGETKRARALCQKLLSSAGPLLLYKSTPPQGSNEYPAGLHPPGPHRRPRPAHRGGDGVEGRLRRRPDPGLAAAEPSQDRDRVNR